MHTYILSHLSGSLENLLQFQSSQDVHPSSIILAGNLIGRSGAKEMIDYLMRYGSEYPAILAGPAEKSFIDWDFSSPCLPPMLPMNEFKGMSEEWLATAKAYIANLPTTFDWHDVLVDAGGAYDLGRGIMRPACKICMPEHEKISGDYFVCGSLDKLGRRMFFLPDDRNGRAVVRIELAEVEHQIA